MQIRRLFVDNPVNPIVLCPEEHHYATRVLRLQPGHVVELITPTGCMTGRIESIDRETRITALGNPEVRNEPGIAVTLFQGLPDNMDKLELIVQKAVELGATRIVPFLSRYTDAKYRKMDMSRKMDRIRKIAREAVRQCKRTVVPLIPDPADLPDIRTSLTELDTTFLFYEKPVQDKLLIPATPVSAGIVIGPEGGFADHEVEQLLEWGTVPVYLPGRTLRTETAGLAALTLVMARFGDYRNLF